VFILLLVGGHFAFLMCYFEPAISTPDAHSYFTQARLIAQKARTYIELESPLQYVGPHWNLIRDNRYYCTHPPGLPTILAPVYRLFGPKATLWINPLAASLSLMGLFLLCKYWVGEGWAFLGAALMAVNPFANEHALFGDAHAPVCLLLLAALLFVMRWTKTYRPGWIFGAGLSMGLIATIRYADGMYLPAIAIFVLLHARRNRAFWYSLIAGIIGAAIPIAALCIRNQIAYGGFWKTGYSLITDQALFAWRYLVGNSVPFIHALMGEGCGLVFSLGLVGITILCARRETWKTGIVFALLVGPIMLVYMSYFWRPDAQSMRFLLPSFYVYTIASVWLLRELTQNHRPSVYVSSIILVLITAWWGLPPSVRSMQRLNEKNAVLAQVTRELEERVEPGSILIASEGINQHLDFIGYWRLVNAQVLRSWRLEPPPMFELDPNVPMPTHGLSRSNEAGAKYRNLTGKELFNAFSYDLWQWAGKTRKVYFLAKKEEINDYERYLPDYDKLLTVDKIELPAISAQKRGAFANVFGPSMAPRREFLEPQGPMIRPIGHQQGPQGPNRIFDLVLDGKPLFLVEWTREGP